MTSSFTKKDKVGVKHLSKCCNYATSYRSIRQINREARCPKCFRSSATTAKNRIEERLLKEKGKEFKLLEYIDNKSPLKIQCPRGHIFTTSRTCSFRDKRLCKQCLEEDKKEALKRKTKPDTSIKLKSELGTKYHIIKHYGKGWDSTYLLYHNCYPGHRHVFKIGYNTLWNRLRNSLIPCPSCYDKSNLVESTRNVKNQLKGSDLIYLGFKILPNHSKKVYLGHYNTCGRLLHYTGRDLYRWRKVSFNCPICTCTTNQANSLEKRAQHFADRIQKIYKGRYYVYRETYISREEHVRILDTKCGKTWNPSADALLRHGTSCPYCQASNGEQRIMDVLDGLGIPYVFQAKMGCIDKAEMPYDVYVPSYNLLIEYQGEQHYKVLNKERFGGLRTFARRKRHDYMKLKFAQNNNCQIRQIPYKVRTYNQIKTYLEDTFKELDKIKIYKEWLQVHEHIE